MQYTKQHLTSSNQWYARIQYCNTSNQRSQLLFKSMHPKKDSMLHSSTFASKALTPTEQCYTNNERELLACVFGTERFHKSLEQILMKNLVDVPVHKQRMLQDYNFSSIDWEKKWPSLMLSPDTHQDAPEIHLDISINHVYITEEKK